MNIRHYSNGVIVADLVNEVHFQIKSNKRGKRKFKLLGKFKKFLKKQNIGYYFLPGNDFLTQILLRDVDEKQEFILKLSW
jgi:hypothetical protein